MSTKPTGEPGPAVDAKGQTATDPTSNVFAIVAAESLRQDGLRIAEFKRLDDLRLLSLEHDREIQSLREKYSDQLREAEAKRIDAVNATTFASLTLSNERAATQAIMLAKQVTDSATALQTAANATREAFERRISDVEQKQYQRGGQTAGASAVIGYVIGASGLLALVFTFLANHLK